MLAAFTAMIIMPFLYPIHVYGQGSANGIKTWIDRENNIKILFSTTPEQPIVATPSALRFALQNLETGKPVLDLLAHVAILGVNTTNQEAMFQLTNVSAVDGHFTINVIFPDIGSYQIITKIISSSSSSSQTHGVASLASFIVVVVPATRYTLNLSGENYITWIGLLIASAVGVSSFLILKNKSFLSQSK
jgi:hypothetical protein